MIKAEFFDIDGTYHREINDITLDNIDELISEAREKGGSGMVSLALSRSTKDFISIDYVGKDQFLVQTERLTKTGSFWQRLFQYPRITYTANGDTAAKELLINYIKRDRSEFEALYS
jgi:hypothetical protein